MKIDLKWTGTMKFTGVADGKEAFMDAKSPIGQGSAMTPKELVGAGLAGCSAMDIVALFKKHKMLPEAFDIETEIETSSGTHPMVFTKAVITYIAKGAISKEVFIEAATLSQTKYCGVSAMLSKAFPIYFRLILNGELIHEAQAQFS